MKYTKRIISFISAIAIVFLLFPIYSYADYSSDEHATWWDYYIHANVLKQDSVDIYSMIGKYITSLGSGDVCSKSEDGWHHADGSISVDKEGVYKCRCKYCGDIFRAFSSDLSAAYQEHVKEMPVNGIDSSGGFVWFPVIKDLYTDSAVSFLYDNTGNRSFDIRSLPCNRENYNYANFTFHGSENDRFIGVDVFPWEGHSCFSISQYFMRFYLKAPVAGRYTMLADKAILGSYRQYDTGDNYNIPSFFYPADSIYNPNSYLIFQVTTPKLVSEDFSLATVFRGSFYLPSFSVAPDVSALVGHENDYTSDSRPASISGKYVVENGDAYEDSSTVIVSEDDNSVYNPVTNTTTTYDDWTYDYSSRTYTFDNSAGDTTTVTYGDENITIKEGDTVYNINYYITPEGGEDPAPTPTPDPGHTHNYTGTITREPSCTLKGVKTYTCECGDSYTESIAALGHDWVIKEQVATVYGDNGEIVTQGYTVYRCTRCGEEYKSTDGTAPASGGGDSSSLWSKIGELLGTIFGGLFKLIGQFLSSVLDVLISLAQEIGDKLATIIEMILGWFDELPKLFAGFLGFLQAVFPFIPAEAMMLLTFGMAAVVFIGIIKALRRR